MKILIVHLSDIHLKAKDNSILKNKEKISKAIQNRTMGIDNLFIVISGDIAFSGKDTEYNQAIELLDSIKNSIEKYSKKKISCIMIPGNHDCYYETKNKKVRETLIKAIQQNGEKAIDNEVIAQCCEVQSNFFDLSEFYHDDENTLCSDKLLSVFKYEFDKYNIIFNSYNTSWISQRHEQPGKMYFPIKRYPEDYFNRKSNLTISILHHPFNWQNPENSREFRAHIEKTSDIVLTGHEHISSKSVKDDLEGNYTEYIEGSVLQDSDNGENSEFNVIIIDLKNRNQKILNYKYNGKIYSLIKDSEWFSYKMYNNTNKEVFEINSKFQEFLNDPGASFTHPQKSELVLDDFFVYPDLKDLKTDKPDNREVLNDILGSDILNKINKSENRILLVGAEKSGKSSLCRILYKHYHDNNYVPIYIDGYRIKSGSLEEFNKLLDRCCRKQYSDCVLEQFNQLENKKKLLIIDDLHKSRLNIKYRSSLLNNINKYYRNIIITANDLFKIEEIVYKEEKKEGVFKDYQQLEILEFGHLLRSKLVNKWNKIGQEEYVEESDLIRNNDNAKKIIDIIIGKNFVPAHPIFLLTILQTIEAGIPHRLEESAYGYYYDFLIAQGLGKINMRNEEIDAYYNYITELANFFFENKIREISNNDFIRFHNHYCEEYAISVTSDKYLENLIQASILTEIDSSFKFKYKYVYYYFVAKYISNNITEKDIKKRVSRMCKRLYRDEFANIIIFLTHLSKNPFILDEILVNSKTIFSEFTPVKFEKDISNINALLNEIPRLVLKNKDVKKTREEKLRKQDEFEFSEKQNSKVENNDEFDLREDIIELDEVSKLNLAFKTVEILGQILKNYYGSLKRNRKLELCEEAYFIGLRSLNLFFLVLGENTDHIVNEIKSYIEKKKLVDKNKIEDASKSLLFGLFNIISYSFIRKISGCIGSENLSETFKEVLNKNDIISVRLVDMSIKLDFFKAFPYGDISKLQKTLAENPLPLTILKRLVINHLYMFPTSYKDKQRICNALKISMAFQRTIDVTSTQKKRI
jgi:predicted MPP superfamily phosphohydrolase/GTPase SAR1 family protein